MAASSSAPDDSSLSDHLARLYPYACLLVGSEDAPDLLIRLSRRAAEHPPADRPDDRDEWLLDLLFDTVGAPAPDGDEAGSASADAPTDPLRQEVATQRLDDALPIALAACSPKERVLLAIDASESMSPPPALSDTECAAAWTTLRDRLRDVLSAAEAALIDEHVTDAALRDAVEEWVADRVPPLPGTLRSRIQTVLETTHSEEPTAETDESPSTEAPSSLLDRLPDRPQPRALLFILLMGTLVLAGGLGVWSLTSSPSGPAPSDTSLVSFSAERAPTVTAERETTDRAEAANYVDATWNRRVAVPRVKGADLQGIGRLQADDTTVPVFLYTRADDTRIAVCAYSYALVDRIQSAATLSTRVRAELARPNRLVTRPDASAEGLLWRDRDDIFVAVAPSVPSDSLRTWVQP